MTDPKIHDSPEGDEALLKRLSQHTHRVPNVPPPASSELEPPGWVFVTVACATLGITGYFLGRVALWW